MKSLREKLKEKGWDKEEIDNAIKRMSSTKKKEKHREFYKGHESTVYWSTLLVMLVSNLLVAVVLIPVIVVMNTNFVYLIVGLLGLVFGIIFNHLIRDIEHLETRHHLLATIFIPLVAVLNLLAIIPVTNSVRLILNIGSVENPLVIAAAYVCMFLLPYLWSSVKEGI